VVSRRLGQSRAQQALQVKISSIVKQCCLIPSALKAEMEMEMEMDVIIVPVSKQIIIGETN
jgi:hypothetical protein